MTRIVIIGRPNVGKSTLFNRLVGQRKALVHNEPGVTRDRIEKKTTWWFQGKAFPVMVIDTGGLGGERFRTEISEQVQMALSEADAALLILDGQSGLTPQDQELIRELRRKSLDEKIPVLGVVNKVDAEMHEKSIADFYSTGIDPLLTISAEHNRGIDDLKLCLAEKLNLQPQLGEIETPLSPEAPRIAIVGRPNVGKSTFVNAILEKARMITSPVAGTTIDAVDSITKFNGRDYVLIDTAGIRRKSKTERGVEVLSVVQTKKTLENADLAILVLDGESGISEQDEKIGGMIEESGCGVILAINKWDTQANNVGFSKETAAERVRSQMAYLRYAPILFLSAKLRQGFGQLPTLIEEILHQRKLKIPTHEFTEWVRREATIHNPHNAKFYLCHQSGRHPPTFVCHVNDPEKIRFSLKRHLVNAIRERWGYMGNPIRLNFVKGRNQRRS